MLSYKDYTKTKVAVELTLSEWDFLKNYLRANIRELAHKNRDIRLLSTIADAIEYKTYNKIYGGND